MERIKENNGITLVALVITILVIMILTFTASFTMSGSIDLSKFQNIKAQVQIMQSNVNVWNQKYKNQEKNTILNDLLSHISDETEKNTIINQMNITEAIYNKYINAFDIPDENISKDKAIADYLFLSGENIKKYLDIDGVELDFIVSIKDNDVRLADGIQYENEWYYTLQDFDLYNEVDSNLVSSVSYSAVKDSNFSTLTVYNIAFHDDDTSKTVPVSKFSIDYSDDNGITWKTKKINNNRLDMQDCIINESYVKGYEFEIDSEKDYKIRFKDTSGNTIPNTEGNEEKVAEEKVYGEALLMQRSDSSAFWQENYRTNITEIAFKKEKFVPSDDHVQSWDLQTSTSTEHIYAYVDNDENEEGKYKLTVVSPATIYATSCSLIFHQFKNVNTIKFDNFDTSKVTNMEQMFYRCDKIQELDLNGFDTSNVKNMALMFYACENLTSLNVSNFVTNNVESMRFMFHGCTKLTQLNLNSFNTSNVKNMSYMFGELKLSTLKLINFDTSNVKDMSYMFANCSNLNEIDVSSFNTKNVENMSYMFWSSPSIEKLDLSSFDTLNVKNMKGMFRYMTGLKELNIINFNLINTTDASDLFSYCTKLKTIYVSNYNEETEKGWKTDFEAISNDMFLNCNLLVGQNGTKYDSNYKDKTYARIDQAVYENGTYVSGDKGYFTYKAAQ